MSRLSPALPGSRQERCWDVPIATRNWIYCSGAASPAAHACQYASHVTVGFLLAILLVVGAYVG